MLQLIREIRKNRELIWALALKELHVRYKRSALGFLWALLNPLLMMMILTMVFSTVMRVPVHDYPIFLISTLLPWTFFSQSLAYSVESIVSNGGHRLEPYQFSSIDDSVDLAPRRLQVPVLLDVALPADSICKFGLVYSRVRFFLRDGQRFLPRYGSHPANSSAGLVL